MSKDQEHGKSEDGITQNGEGLKRRDLLLSGSIVGSRIGAVGCGVRDFCASAAIGADSTIRANSRTLSSS